MSCSLLIGCYLYKNFSENVYLQTPSNKNSLMKTVSKKFQKASELTPYKSLVNYSNWWIRKMKLAKGIPAKMNSFFLATKIVNCATS